MDPSARRDSLPIDHPGLLFEEGLTRQRRGDVEHAMKIYEQVLVSQPRHAPALHLLGSLLLQRGDLEKAVACLTTSVDANPQVAAAHIDLAVALQRAGRSPEALPHYERAMVLEPGSLPAQFNRAVLLQELGRLAESIEGFRQVIRREPRLVDAHFNLAVALANLRRWEEALAAYDRCLELVPQHVEAITNRGVVLLEMGRAVDALLAFDLALRFAPGLPQALNNRGNALRALGRIIEALQSFDRAIALQPDFAEAHRNRANALRASGDREAALASYDAALRCRPHHAETLLDRVHVLADLRRYGEAADSLSNLITLAPRTAYAQGLRLHVQGLAGDWRHYLENAQALVEANDRGEPADFPFSFLAASHVATAQYRCAQQFARDKYPARTRSRARNPRYRHAKIRLAYVSGDFRAHPVSALLARVFELHDRTRFETTAISLQPPDGSRLGARVANAFDNFVDVSELGDEAVAALIAEREIDIAVDLAGFTQGSRTGIFAARPAPVQVNYLGFPGTMGTPYMDYLFADEFLVPSAVHGSYQEKIVWLPDCFQPYDDARRQPLSPRSRQELGLPENGLVLCCFNNAFKINPTVFAIWMRVLAAVPGAVIWLLGEHPMFASNLRSEASRHGIRGDRLIFAPRVPYEQHLARLPCADLFLDTLPFNAGSTASDALSVGVPLLTCAGEAMASRMAGSLLRAAGLPDLITHTLSDYEGLALRLARDPEILTGLRRRLAAARNSAPLFDSARYCRHLETAFTTMWQRAERGKPPKHFAVEPQPVHS